MQVLRHDLILHPAKVKPHLKNVPNYLGITLKTIISSYLIFHLHYSPIINFPFTIFIVPPALRNSMKSKPRKRPNIHSANHRTNKKSKV